MLGKPTAFEKAGDGVTVIRSKGIPKPHNGKSNLTLSSHRDRVHGIGMPGTHSLPLRAITLESGASPRPAGPFTIGHLHLQVADLGLAAAYQTALGLRVTQADYPGSLFLAREGYLHHLALNTWRTDPQASRPDRAVGLVGWEMTRPEGTKETSWLDPNGFLVTLVGE